MNINKRKQLEVVFAMDETLLNILQKKGTFQRIQKRGKKINMRQRGTKTILGNKLQQSQEETKVNIPYSLFLTGRKS